MTETFAPWRQPGYSDIVSAKPQDGDDIQVEFANGDVVVLQPSALGISGATYETAVADEGLVLRVILEDGIPVDVSWSQIRTATDPEFAKELRRQDSEEAKRLGLRLKALREDRGVSQRELANRVAMSAPQLSKIESGNFDLRVSTVQTLLRALNASFADISGPDAPEISQRSIARIAEDAGVPRDVADRILASVSRPRALRTFERLFGWDARALNMGALRQLTDRRVAVQFKAGKDHDPEDSPLVDLAASLTELIRDAIPHLAYSGVPTDPSDLNAVTTVKGAGVTLASLTAWCWTSGIPVIPLVGGKGFYAAVFGTHEAPNIVLKDTRKFAAFWLFDLAHELGHIAHEHTKTGQVVDLEMPRPRGNDDNQEFQANEYALNVLLPGHQDLLDRVREEARGNYLRFKGAVETVSRENDISPGLLGMVAAYELTEIGENKDRWGSATNLAKSEDEGRAVVQSQARRRLDLERLHDWSTLVDALVFHA